MFMLCETMTDEEDQHLQLTNIHDASCQEAQPTDAGPCREAQPEEAAIIDRDRGRGRRRGKSHPPTIAGWHSFEDEARQAGLDPASLRRAVREGRYPAPASISRHRVYPDGNAQKFAAEQFERRNAPKLDLPPRRGRPRAR